MFKKCYGNAEEEGAVCQRPQGRATGEGRDELDLEGKKKLNKTRKKGSMLWAGGNVHGICGKSPEPCAPVVWGKLKTESTGKWDWKDRLEPGETWSLGAVIMCISSVPEEMNHDPSCVLTC